MVEYVWSKQTCRWDCKISRGLCLSMGEALAKMLETAGQNSESLVQLILSNFVGSFSRHFEL